MTVFLRSSLTWPAAISAVDKVEVMMRSGTIADNICNGRTAALHLPPSSSGTSSGATPAKLHRRPTESANTTRSARSSALDIAVLSPCNMANAENATWLEMAMTFCIGMFARFAATE